MRGPTDPQRRTSPVAGTNRRPAPQNRSQGWPASNRNGGRLQIGMVDRLQAGRVADIKSERVAGLRRNLHNCARCRCACRR